MQSVSGVGVPLPDETLPTLDGEAVRLSTLRGKRRVLYLWGSW
jgi:peroxiredoxin